MVSSFCRSDLVIDRSALDAGCGPLELAEINPFRRPGGESNIGLVVFLTHKEEHAEAILDGEGTWRCPELPVLDRVLNALHVPGQNTGGDTPFGHAELVRVAAWLKGAVRFDRSTTSRQ